MTTQEKKDKIKSICIEMIEDSKKAMIEDIDKALNSGAIDIDMWDEKDKPMITPKCILLAILDKAKVRYSAAGTSHERRINKEVKNLRYFL